MRDCRCYTKVLNFEEKFQLSIPCAVQVQGQISLLSDGVLSFGLPHYASSEFELLAEELLMSDSVIKVSGKFVNFLVCGSFPDSIRCNFVDNIF